MDRRKFIGTAGVLSTGALLAATLSSCGREEKTRFLDEITFNTHNIDELYESGESFYLSPERIQKLASEKRALDLQIPCQDERGEELDLIVDMSRNFIAYKGRKLIEWDSPKTGEDPIIYATPVINGNARTDLRVPLSTSAVHSHPLWHENISIDTDWRFLPKPPNGQRYHDIEPMPEASDPRHISHYFYQKTAEKLAHNILNWEPDKMPEGEKYPLSNNRLLLHLMARESACHDRLGPNAYQKSVAKPIYEKAEDGIGVLSHRYGKYAGLSQMGVNLDDGEVVNAIAGTPLATQLSDGSYTWSGMVVNGEAIKNAEDFYGNWQAQTLALLYTQLLSLNQVDKWRKTEPSISEGGAFATSHLLGPRDAEQVILHQADLADDNGTKGSWYYEDYSQYKDKTLYSPSRETRYIISRDNALGVTIEGQKRLQIEYERNGPVQNQKETSLWTETTKERSSPNDGYRRK